MSTPPTSTAFLIRFKRWLAWPSCLPIVVMLLAGALIVFLDVRLGDHIASQVRLATDVVLMGMVFPLSIAFLVNQLTRVRRDAAAAQARAVEDERQRISRDLHDSIAQQVGYIHLKLDSLAKTMPATAATAAMRQELEQMREISSEAYDEVYTLLTNLRDAGSATLAETLLARAKWVGSRAGFEVVLAQRGEPQRLRMQPRQQILFIFWEALSNVEKHAAARHVDIDVAWRPDDLVISLRDDGRGFVPDAAQRPSHFGLGIMRERANEIGSRLVIDSRPNGGTAVRLYVPLEDNRDTAHPPIPGHDAPAPERR